MALRGPFAEEGNRALGGEASEVVRIEDPSQVGEARRLVRGVAALGGLDEVAIERAAIIATELGTNVVRHGGGGVLVVRSAGKAVEMLAIDHGPGIPDLEAAMRDGFSTGRTPGTGLGAVRRMSQRFGVDSRPGHGTVVFSAVTREGAVEPVEGLDLGAICCALRGEPVSGDLWSARQDQDGFSVLMADGLGHGTQANQAARAGVEAFAARPVGEAPGDTLQACHQAMRGSRGAALAVVRAEPGLRRVRFAGVGNVAARIVGATQTQHLVSMSGIVGQDPLRVREFTYTWSPGDTLVMASDGLRTSWTADSYGGIWQRPSPLLAGILLRDQERGRDDVTVVVARWRTP